MYVISTKSNSGPLLELRRQILIEYFSENLVDSEGFLFFYVEFWIKPIKKYKPCEIKGKASMNWYDVKAVALFWVFSDLLINLSKVLQKG